MKIPVITLALILFFCYKGNSQTATPMKTIRHICYLEIAGIGGYGSLNYENVLYQKNNFMLNIRSGISTYRLTDYMNKFNPDIIIPLAANVLYGKKHCVEFGLGQTLTTIVYSNPINFEKSRSNQVSSNGTLGYRFQKSEGGIVFRGGYMPIVENNKYFRHWAGVSFGYAF